MDDFGGIFSLHASLLSSQQTKGVNIKDVQSTKLSPENHGNKYNPSMNFTTLRKLTQLLSLGQTVTDKAYMPITPATT